MKLEPIRLGAGSRLNLGAHPRPASLVVAMCSTSSTIEIDNGSSAIFCPVFGSAVVVSGDLRVGLAKGDIYVGDPHANNVCVVSQRGICLVFVGAQRVWAGIGRKYVLSRVSISLYPCKHRNAALSKQLLRFARGCFRDDDSDRLEREFLGYLIELQSCFNAMVGRCPGAGFSRKQSIFFRLQRVRNYMEACAHHELDVAKLAWMANYSVGHFITTFRQVFLETPYSAISRHRIKSAGALLSGSSLGIGDIAQAIGFSSRSSFTRAVRRHLGSSPSGVRADVVDAEEMEPEFPANRAPFDNAHRRF